MAGHKPHIHLVKGLMGLPFWVCRMPGKIDGVGIDPQSAYRDWRLQNFSRWGLQRKIDIGRYAGSYGGSRQVRDVATYVCWWASICDYGKQIAIGCLIAAAATCWVASWMFSR